LRLVSIFLISLILRSRDTRAFIRASTCHESREAQQTENSQTLVNERNILSNPEVQVENAARMDTIKSACGYEIDRIFTVLCPVRAPRPDFPRPLSCHAASTSTWHMIRRRNTALEDIARTTVSASLAVLGEK